MSQTPSIEIRRHCRKLSEKQTDELVGAVAELIVAFWKQRGHGEASATDKPGPARNKSPRTGRQ